MSPEAQRIALAEVCGWEKVGRYFWSDEYEDFLKQHGPRVIVPHFNGHLLGYWKATDAWATPPDYPNDLNAIREVRGVLTRDQQAAFIFCLESIVARDPKANLWSWALVNASAAQQAEAILRATNKWGDDK